MSRTLWLVGLSFLVWVPLVYIVIHRDNNVDEPRPTLQQSALRYRSTNGNILSINSSVQSENHGETIAASRKHNVNFPRRQPHSAKQTEQLITAERFRVDPSVGWKDFVQTKHNKPGNSKATEAVSSTDLIVCNANVVRALQRPGLSTADYQWCEWALNPNGGSVVVRVCMFPSTYVPTG